MQAAAGTGGPITSATGWWQTPEGIRGRYLNDLTRLDAQRWAAAFAPQLWQAHPWVGRTELDRDSCESMTEASTPSRRGLTVIVGYDERPTSPDLAIGAVTGLRQAGCRVIDLGPSTKPMWRFALSAWRAEAGLYVTGAGAGSSATGLDVCGPAGEPFAATTLATIASSARQAMGRLSRTAASVAAAAIEPEYLRTLGAAFHALRPLTVAIMTGSPLQRRLLERLFTELPCRVRMLPGWEGLGTPGLDLAAAAARYRRELDADSVDVAVALAEDGQTLVVLDESGQWIPADRLLPWLFRAIVEEHPEGTSRTAVVADDSINPPADHWQVTESPGVSTTGRPLWWRAPLSDLAKFHDQMRQTRAAVGLDPQGRIWLGGNDPVCDGLATVAALLRAMSWSDAPLSRLTNG